MSDENRYFEGDYEGNVIERYKQQRDDECEQAPRALKEKECIQEKLMENERDRLAERYDLEGDELDRLMEEYAKEDKLCEYLVDGAILRCTEATLEDFKLSEKEDDDNNTVSLNIGTGEEDLRQQTILRVSENPMSLNGLIYATTRDTVMNTNIFPFKCNCKISINRPSELKNILADENRNQDGVCKHLMKLSSEWENIHLDGIDYLKKADNTSLAGGVTIALDPSRIDTEGITRTSTLFCKHGGFIYPKTAGQDAIREEQIVTMKQMKDFGFSLTVDELIELNRLLKQYGLEDKGSIAIFMATCGHESHKGTQLMEGGTASDWNGYNENTRGAGYIQLTEKSQSNFYKYLGEAAPENRTKDIAENYAWEASIWFWVAEEKGDDVYLNNYVIKHGTSEEVFLITQYFVNGYLTEPNFNDDLASIRGGENYEIDLIKETLTVKGRTYRLPVNYADRLKNYEEAMAIFMGN